MTIPKIPKQLRDFVRQRAGYRCEYCRTSEWLIGQECEIDHIIPRARGGETTADNLCLACASCNAHKLDHVEVVDQESGDLVAFFHPRKQIWNEHFEWSLDGTLIFGITTCGKSTVDVLHMNRPLIVAARSIWVSIQRHPPIN